MHVSAVTTNLCVPISITQGTPKPDLAQEKDLSKQRRDPSILLAILLAILPLFLLPLLLLLLLPLLLLLLLLPPPARKPSVTKQNAHCMGIFANGQF